MGANRSVVLILLWVIGCGESGTSNFGADGGTASGGSSSKSGGTGSTGGGTAVSTGGKTIHGGTLATGGAVGGTAGRVSGGVVSSTGGRLTGGVMSGTGGRVGGTVGGRSGGAGGTSTGQTGGATGGVSGQGGANTANGGVVSEAGNPDGSCSTGVPERGQAVDTTNPTSVVGTGTEESCEFSQLKAAAALGGVITFNCGSGKVTILVTSTLTLPTNKNTVIDGGNRITLDGGNAVQILSFRGDDFMKNDMGLTLQHITLIQGKATPTEKIPTRPAPCSQGWNDGEGGAIYMQDGNLTIIDSIFMNNSAAPLGPDTGGGAIYVLGSKRGVMIVNSTFTKNSASNAGAVGCLFAELNVYNSLFTNNTALGNGANYDDDSKCSFINNDQNEVGSGGNGGALYSDGTSKNITLCGNAILNNKAGQEAFGGGLFFTSNDMGGTLTIRDTTMTGNTGGSWTVVASGSVDNVGTAVGTNAKSITVTNSTLQGMR